MPKLQSSLNKHVVELLQTLGACTIVALIVASLNDELRTQSVVTIFLISYTYGLTIHASVHYWTTRFSHQTHAFRYIIPGFAGFLIGTLLILAVFKLRPDGSDTLFLAPLTRILFYALLATTLILYVFILMDQKNEMRSMLKAAELNQEKSEKELLQSELRLLQSQIEPHFLFNTLANIRALITVDPEKSQLILDSLTTLLRQSLRQSRNSSNTLQSEVEFCKSYLTIQQIRIGDRLEVNLNIEDDVDMHQPFPPLLLLPIVENAIEHGIEPVSRPTSLEISIQNIDRDTLEIAVVDTGVGLGNSTVSGHGVGLSNTRNRILSLFEKGSSLTIKQNESHGVTVTLRIVR